MLERFGQYTLLERIGVGGMAEVFRARRSGLAGFEKEIVLKRIRSHLSTSKPFVDMFLGEAKLAAQLNHPNIVQIYDLGKIGDAFFIAMEYVPGRDMSSIIPQCRRMGIPFPVEYAMKIGSHICEALNYAHQKRDPKGRPLHIVHRDVSPENIRVAWTGVVKILDFGIAKAANHFHETQVGQIKGKLAYMSPEQVMGKNLDHRSDVFSLGAVLYEVLTGLKVSRGENDLAMMRSIVESEIYPPSYFREDIPPIVESIVMKALSKDRNRRYQTTSDMQFDIDSFLAGNDFTPSNMHLSNFIQQLFTDALSQEAAQRLKEEKQKQSDPSIPPPLPDDFEYSHTSNEQTGYGMLLRLNSNDLQKLEKLAAKRHMSAIDVALEMIEHQLRFVD